MFKKLFLGLLILSSNLLLAGCSLKKTPAALQIDATPVANVFVDGKLLGKTPYQGSDWKAGEVAVKLIPDSATTPLASWEGRVQLTSGVLTLINREFAVTENESAVQILNLEKIKDKKASSLSVVSDPDVSLITIDGEAKGFTPLLIDQIGIGDHQITIAKEGYVEKTVKAKTIAGFKLMVNVKLAQKPGSQIATASGTPMPTSKASKVTPTTSPRVTSLPGQKQVLIKDTPTSWLRVRMEPSTTATEAAKVNPGEKFPFLDEESGWLKIEYEPGKEGWISGQYATKI
ncbi:hypothetical protein COS54_02700 [Candidatus Shapirobacteria bacterium CG03_land_8_20_14_0_80_39_12]|uniref:SH3b domain-containing protein n=2 Tax=Microgenomates group TaxID=1794810 RepID=A0A2M7BBU4_9BACT|nr:MAG: hypothetical protein COS54_02700 [Candidatus Shapirobacteria bacterium CG03_land_8_20_14_0_80_39_12]